MRASRRLPTSEDGEHEVDRKAEFSFVDVIGIGPEIRSEKLVESSELKKLFEEGRHKDDKKEDAVKPSETPKTSVDGRWKPKIAASCGGVGFGDDGVTKKKLVSLIKAYQRAGAQQRDTWKNHCSMAFGGARDLERHDVGALSAFCHKCIETVPSRKLLSKFCSRD